MEKYYSIKDLEKLSGIKAHTIRIWEKRYELLTPSRTDTNIRLYDNNQLRKLLNVSIMLKKGHKISKVSKLKEEDLFTKVENYLSQEALVETNIEPLLEGMIVSMVEFNELRFEKIFSSAVLRMGLRDTMLKLIYPLLYRVGLLWGVNKISPAQEHFISNLIKQKLYVALDGLSFPRTEDKVFLLFLPYEEYHVLGLLFTNYLIRQAGYKSVYLGADVPYEGLQEAISIIKPTHLMTFFIVQRPEIHISKYLDNLRNDYPQLNIGVAGASLDDENIQVPETLQRLRSADDLLEWIEAKENHLIK